MDTTTALFCSGDRYIFVCVEEDANESASADAAARGYQFIGSISIADGVPRVSIEDGYELQMLYAGAVFAQWFGPRLKQYQLGKQAEARQ